MQRLYVRRELIEDFNTWMQIPFYDRETDKYVDSITVMTPHRNTERGIEDASKQYMIEHPGVIVEYKI